MRYPSRPSLNLTTLISSLQACAQNKNLTKGKEIHAFMLVDGFLSSPLSTTSLISMYSKCNAIADALRVFHTLSADYHNVFTYNAIVAGFVANEMPKPAIESYWRMRVAGIMPDRFTFPCVIKACSDVKGVLETMKIHGLLFKFGLELDIYVGSALVHSYLKFGFMDGAHQVFDELPNRDVVLWNAMINGFSHIGQFDRALDVYKKMGEQGVVPSKFTVTGILSIFAIMGDLNSGRAIHGFVLKMGHDSGVAVLNALIDMYGKCKCIKDSMTIFEMIPERDIFSWNSIICIHEQCSDHDGALRLFSRMLRAGVKPDLVTVTNVLPACAHLAALIHGKEIHSYMIVNGLENDDDGEDEQDDDIYVKNAVMDMYAKCGHMREARLIFDRMSHKDVASWNIMIKGYGMHGFGVEALDLFSGMHDAQLKPDDVTFVGVLSACSHAGLLSQGREFLAQMQSQYGVVPAIEHYTCVIDMLGRAGRLEEAYELVSAMPIEANPVVWRAFLAACLLHGDAVLAEVAAERALELQPEHCGSYVLMSNVYGAAGRYEDVSEVRHAMRQHNVKKAPGCSWIELGDGLHVFVTGDRTHPEDYLIYTSLNSLTARLYEYGYMPNA
ncbi:pentatricopeptide repeat-containing protein At3g14730 isoform X2 [Diospyros lotus]|nr:pentatricopeptide repeat-containing protein At3g14730 isoform X2 [Diospyros lotus]XP_052200696.1 pentatricopeptide repeat-containing protein At3g14730 isoform X2 [Diospyros lotus]XP_052200697.1 pentatricopeptide repeat-containing protein At3g14730 isoform X2 [Diospyros lotus]XP_052200698.1 pentatricopeptide repeat-containing protein At3g14730 isoform X2 [Diospyros lotus]XP_052200699.1 pentatricopeptide repeat-containing protein At3g14730 isoform X2 [Diospyros lotus]XP_052200700.1 pentatrico